MYRDKNWKNNQRIESHGEVLKMLAEDILNKELKIPYNNIKLITYMTHYLYCLGVYSQTCGPWEEVSFPKGSNCDCASVVMAFERIQEMLKNSSNAKNKIFKSRSNIM